MNQSVVVLNALAHFYDVLQRIGKSFDESDDPVPGLFRPRFELPAMDANVRQYLSVSDIKFTQLGFYSGKTLALMDLMGNPGTQTTKTFASLIMVLRAVRHIRESGERLVLITPSSANKATALRDAVARAISAGLVGADEIRIVVVVPAASARKLRRSPLDQDESAEHNPVAVFMGQPTSNVKVIAELVAKDFAVFGEGRRVRCWYTLDVRNYLQADAVRALAESEVFSSNASSRTHAHSVSSAYGLLGHHLGWSTYVPKPVPVPKPEYLLVQQLSTPDMVQGVLDSNGEASRLPSYVWSNDRSRFEQNENVHFPLYTKTVDDEIDSTFYTRQPPTLPGMVKVIGGLGGNGIVVSSLECADRLAETRVLLERAGLQIGNESEIAERSLMMAVTGTLNAIDRGFVKSPEVLIHGSGHYEFGAFEQLPFDTLCEVADGPAFGDVFRRAMSDWM